MVFTTLPTIFNYHRSVHLTRILDWNRHSDNKWWVSLAQSFSQYSLSGFTWCDHNSYSLWSTQPQALCFSSDDRFFRKMDNYHTRPPYSQFWTIWYFHLPALQVLWEQSGIYRASHFLDSGKWPSVDHLTSRSGRFQFPFWQALQLRHFLSSDPNPASFSRPITPFVTLYTRQGPVRYPLSITYSLLTNQRPKFKHSYVLSWERDLNSTFYSAQTSHILDWSLKSFISTRYQVAN